MQTGKANYRLAARLRGNELLLDADLRKAVEEEHLRAVRRAEGLKCCADRRAFAESVEWERLGDDHRRRDHSNQGDGNDWCCQCTKSEYYEIDQPGTGDGKRYADVYFRDPEFWQCGSQCSNRGSDHRYL